MQQSQQVQQLKARADLITPDQVGGPTRIAIFEVTVTGEPETHFQICRIPTGRSRIITNLSRLDIEGDGPWDGLMVSFGHGDYSDPRGMPVKQDDTAFGEPVEIGTGAVRWGLNRPIQGSFIHSGVYGHITAVFSKPLPVGTKFNGFMLYS